MSRDRFGIGHYADWRIKDRACQLRCAIRDDLENVKIVVRSVRFYREQAHISEPKRIRSGRKAGRGIGNRPTYVLESTTGGPLLYANPVAGVELDSQIGHTVELIGTTTYYGELRAYYMWVTQVRQLQ